MKKAVPYILLLAILGCIYSFFSQINSAKESQPKNFCARIPINAAFAIESQNFYAFKNMLEDNQLLFPIISSSPAVQVINDILGEEISGDDNLVSNACFSYHQYGKTSFGFILQFRNSENSYALYKEALQKSELSGRDSYEGYQIATLEKDSVKLFGIAFKESLVISDQLALIQSFIKWNEADVNTDNLANHWLELRHTRGKKELGHLYCNPKFWNNFISNANLAKALNAKHLSSINCLDIKVGTSDLRLTGIAEPNWNHPAYLSHNMGLAEPTLFMFVPQSQDNVQWWHINSWKNYLKNSDFSLAKCKDQKTAKTLDPDLFEFQVDEIFGSEISLCKRNNNVLFVAEIKDEAGFKSLVNAKKTDSYRSYDIFSVSKFWNEFFKIQDEVKHGAIINKHLYMASSLSHLESCINEVLTQQVLGDSKVINDIKKEVNLNGSYINTQINSIEVDNPEALKIQSIVDFQIHVFSFLKDKKQYQEYFIKLDKKEEEEEDKLWTVSLESQLLFQPSMVSNHYTDEQELLLLEENGSLALHTKSGRRLWKKNLPYQAQRPPIQIDAFKNGKLQLLFNTKNSIELIDRNGNDVAPFPVISDQNFSSPALVVDYDLNRDYRIILAQGNRILNYILDGKETEGWDVFVTKAIVREKPWYIKIGKKDYIILLDEAGSIYVLNRRGEIRYACDAQIKNAASEVILHKGADISDSYFEFWNQSAELVRQYLNGKESRNTVDEIKGLDQANLVNFKGKEYWVILQAQTLYVLGSKNQIIWVNNDVSFPFIETENKDYPLLINLVSEEKFKIIDSEFKGQEYQEKHPKAAIIANFSSQGSNHLISCSNLKIECRKISTKK